MNEHESSVYFVAWVFGHIASGGAVIASVAGYAPPIAACVALIWYVIQIAESETAAKWSHRYRQHRIDKLKKKLHDLERPRP